MKLKLMFFILFLILGLSSTAYACTSFALYGNQIFYGMNFDYFSIPLKFMIESNMGMNIFHLSFLYDQTIDDPDYEGYFAKTCGINSNGLFCASQEIEPHVEGKKTPGKGEAHIDEQYETLSSVSNVSQVKESAGGKQWIQFLGPSIHNLFADINGNAMVTETDNNENFITDIDKNFIVMTNFSNHDLTGEPYTRAQGAGADRYITAYDYILNNNDSFTVDKGFELLKNVVMNDEKFSTLCSMIFTPRTNHIYIALSMDFERIWKVSLDSKVIETFKGHDTYAQKMIGAEGILASDLV